MLKVCKNYLLLSTGLMVFSFGRESGVVYIIRQLKGESLMQKPKKHGDASGFQVYSAFFCLFGGSFLVRKLPFAEEKVFFGNYL